MNEAYGQILNDTLDLTKIEHTFAFDNSTLSEAAQALIQPREIFVVCDTLTACYVLMRRFVYSLKPSAVKADWARLHVKIGYDEYKFIIRDKLDIVVRGRHQTEIIEQETFERALDIHAEMKGTHL